MSDDLKSPVTAADCSEEWIAPRRDLIVPGGRALQAGERCIQQATETTPAKFEFWIEIKSITPLEQLATEDPLRTNAWCVLALPKGASQFSTREDRDAVLAKLQGGK